MNDFINALNFNGMTLTENGALTNMSTGSALMDQFGKAGNYRDRNIDDVFLTKKLFGKKMQTKLFVSVLFAHDYTQG